MKIFQKSFFIGLAAAGLLVLAGLLVFREAQSQLSAVLLSLGGALLALALYGLAAGLWLPRVQRLDPQILTWAARLGLAAGAVFALEIRLEYILLPENNSGWGLIEFGLVFSLYLAAGLITAIQTRRFRAGLSAAVWTAMAASLVWLIALLGVTYLFYGTQAQVLVFRAEGNFQDFQASGMSSFEAFILGDFYGAAFYHLLLIGPLAAVILGSLGAGIGLGVRKLRRKNVTD